MNDEEYYKKAKKIVEKKKNFRSSAVAFAVMMPVFIFINLWTSPRYLWFFWPLLGWGISLVSMYYEAYVKPKKDLQDNDEIRREMEKLRRRDGEFLDLDNRPRRDDLDRRMDLREVRGDYDERDLV